MEWYEWIFWGCVVALAISHAFELSHKNPFNPFNPCLENNNTTMATFISIPVTGHDLNAVRKHCEAYKDIMDCVTPFDCEWEPDHEWEWYMVRTLEALGRCNKVIFCRGWQESRGCRMEHAFAEYKGITMEYEG